MAEPLAKYVVALEAQTAQYQRKLDDANRRLARFHRQQTGTLDKIAVGFKRLAIAAAGYLSFRAISNSLVGVNREFQVLNASLITATGSSEGAAEAFDALEEFARQTPYSLEQSVSGFVKLVNLGLDPSERALRSFGNTAAAMGKDLSQFIEAVADAATAEFERLKVFGIKAKNQGDTIAFVFRGTTTLVKNNARDIQEYLTKLGENEFAGAMQQRVKTLDGAISNLGDSWDGLFRTIGDAGVGQLMTDMVNEAGAALDRLSRFIEEGGVQALFDTFTVGFDKIGGDIDRSLSFIGDLVFADTKAWGELFDLSANILVDAFVNLIPNVRAALRAITIEAASFLDRAIAYVKDGLSLLENPENYGAGAVNINTELAAMEAARLKSHNENLAALDKLRAEQKKNVEELRRAATAAATGGEPEGKTNEQKDRLAKFGRAQDEANAQALEKVRLALRTQEEVIQESYDKRLEIIKENTKDNLALQLDLITRLNKQRDEQLANISDSFLTATIFGKRAAENMQDIFADFLFDPFEKGVKGMVQSFGDALRKMAAQAAAAQIFKLLGKFVGGIIGGGTPTNYKFGEGPATFAHGGRLRANRVGLVGEGGPELIGPANFARDIVPMSRAGWGGLTVQVDATGAVSPAEVERRVRAGVQRGIHEYDRLIRNGRLD